jgi:hypothetical protein
MFSRMAGKRYEGIFMAGGRYVKTWFELEQGRAVADWGGTARAYNNLRDVNAAVCFGPNE